MTDTRDLKLVLFWVTFPIYIIGFVGNALVIRIVHKTRAMHTTTNYFLVNLAVGDVITISFMLLRFFSYLYGHFSYGFGNFVCKILVVMEISIVVSSFTLTVLAVERYHALLKPFRTGLRLKEDNIKKAIAVIWIASVLLCSPFFFYQEWSESHSICIGTWSLRMNQQTKIYLIINAVFSTYIPLAVMLYCYGSLTKGLYFTKTVCPETKAGLRARSSEKKKLVVTFILATAGFVCGYVPFVVFYTVIALGGDEQIDFNLYSDLSTVFIILFNCSLCLNPILYAFRSSNFQKGFKRIILCRRPPSPIEASAFTCDDYSKQNNTRNIILQNIEQETAAQESAARQ